MSVIRRHLIATFLIYISAFYSVGQTLIMNEVSNGSSGNQEYVEFVVVDNTVTYNCNGSSPPCIDIRGWIFDDNSGYHNNVGVAAGAMRFSQDPVWACVPLGTIILIYNNTDPNSSLPANDISMDDGNCTLSAPIDDPNLFETNTTTPGAVACSYPATGWTPGGNWNNTFFANGGDCARIVNLAGCEVFSVCWGTANANNLIYFAGSGQDDVWYFNDGDPANQANWSQGCAGDMVACGGDLQTPGAPNNAANAAYIAQFNNGCSPITPILVDAIAIDAGCDCDGFASASASGSIPGYTFTWYDDSFNPIGQTGPNATNLCEGTYHVIGESSIGCMDTATVVIVSSGGLTLAVNSSVICEGQSTSLTATPSIFGGTYLWSPGGQTTPSITISPVSTTIYSVTYTFAGCEINNLATVTVNPLPEVNAGIDQTICIGTTLALSGSGADAYNWDNGIINGVSFTPLDTTTYTVTGTDSNGCVNTDQIIVTVNPLPNVNAGVDQVICLGENITLVGLGALNYFWDNGISDGVIFTPASSATLTVTGVDANGCQNSDPVEVIVNPLPMIDAGIDQTICEGSIAVLSAEGTASFVWNNGIVDGISFSPLVGSATYTVTCTDSNGCQNTDQTVISVNPIPLVDAGEDITICEGSAITLNGFGATSFSWDNGVTDGLPFTPTNGSLIYTVTGTSPEGCLNNDQVVVTVNTLPTVFAGVDQIVCEGTLVSLEASGAITYFWDNDISNGSSFTPTIGTALYTVTGTDTNGCTDSDQVVVTTHPNPNPVITGPTDYCTGAFSTISTSTPYSTYLWSNGNNNPSTNVTITDNPITVQVTDTFGCAGASSTFLVTENSLSTFGSSITICEGQTAVIHGNTESVAGVYSQTFMYPSGCDSTSIVTLVVNSLPAVYAGGDTTICFGNQITLSGSGVESYVWDNGVSNDTPFTPEESAIYTLTGTDSNGCQNTDQIVVTVNPLPVVNAGPDQAVCDGSTLVFNASGAINFSWNNGIEDGVNFIQEIGAIVYTVTGTDLNGCRDTDQVTAIVHPIPNVSAGPDLTICDGSAVTLTGFGATFYIWDNGVINGTPFEPIQNGTYSVNGMDVNGCIGTDQMNISVTPIPVLTIVPDVTHGCVPLTVNFTSTTANATDCIWNFDSGDIQTGCGVATTTFDSPGCYSVTFSSTVNGCTVDTTSTDLICVESNPIAAFNQDENLITTLNTSVQFENTSFGATAYEWNFGDNSSISNEINASHTYPSESVGSYDVMLVAISDLGCRDTAFSDIRIEEELIYYIPNTFTPDDDEFNQTFKPVFTSGIDPFDYNLMIYDRWGELIYESHNTQIGWDGSYGSEGSIVPDGIYTWKIEFKASKNDQRIMNIGHLVLIR